MHRFLPILLLAGGTQAETATAHAATGAVEGEHAASSLFSRIEVVRTFVARRSNLCCTLIKSGTLKILISFLILFTCDVEGCCSDGLRKSETMSQCVVYLIEVSILYLYF